MRRKFQVHAKIEGEWVAVSQPDTERMSLRLYQVHAEAGPAMVLPVGVDPAAVEARRVWEDGTLRVRMGQ